MTRSIKTFLTLVLSVFALMSFVVFGTNMTKVKADTPAQEQAVFAMVDSVELKTMETGMRFKVEMNEDTFNRVKNNDNVKMYFIIAPRVFFDAQTDGQYMNMTQKLLVEVDDYSKVYKDGEVYYANGCVFKMKPENLALDYTAVACIETDNAGQKSYEYAEKSDNVNNVYGLVNTAILTDGIEVNVLKNILNVYDFMGTADYPVVISNTNQYNAFVAKANGGLDVSAMKAEIATSVDRSGASFEAGKAPVVEYTISTPADFEYYVENVNSFRNAEVKIANDIDMTGFTVIAQEDGIMSGVLDGQGHVISNLDVNQRLFFKAGSDTDETIFKNLAMVNVSFKNNYNMHGLFTIITGEKGVKFDNCYLQLNASTGNGPIDRAIANEIITSLTLKNTILNKTHKVGATTDINNYPTVGTTTCVFNVENSYSIGTTTVIGVTDTIENFFFVEDAKGAVADIIANGGVIVENGWNTSCWSLSEDNILRFKNLIVAKGEAPAVQISDEATFAALLSDTTGLYTDRKVVLTRNLDMTNYPISAIGTFSGVLDGQGFVVENIKENNKGNVVILKNATIKNIGITISSITGAWFTGIFGGSGNATLENVYIKAPANAASNPQRDFGLFSTLSGDVTLNNVVFDKQYRDISNGYTSCVLLDTTPAYKVNYSNFYSIGSATKVANSTNNLNGSGEILYTNNAVGAVTAIQSAGLTAQNGWNTSYWSIVDGKLMFGNLVVAEGPISIDSPEALHAVFTDTTNAYAGKIIVLTADIDMANYKVAAPGTFAGTLDGQGYVVSNLKYASGVVTLQGATIKNVALIVTEISSRWASGLFGSASGATLENVYVKAVATSDATTKDYALFGDLTGPVVLNNVIVDKTHGISYGLLNYLGTGSLAYSNLYAIGNTTTLLCNSSLGVGTGTAMIDTPANALADITTKGLTAQNGWNTSCWSIDASGNLLFGVQSKVTVIAKA